MFRSVLPADSPVRVGNRWVFPDGRTLPVISGGDGPLDRTRQNAVDGMVRRLETELDERNSFIAGLAQIAQEANNGEGRDLTGTEMELVAGAQSRIAEIRSQIAPMREASRLATESRQNVGDLDRELANSRRRLGRPEVEYRSAGAYITDLWHARAAGDADAAERLEIYNRAAAHQTTADNPGLLPQRIVEPVINGVDEARPLVNAIGPQDLGQGSWAYARVTQHTQVGVQAAEKTELASRKMLVTLTPITAPTYGGYVNVSRQNIRRSTPQILDMVISDLGGQYAIETEDAACVDLEAAATAGTTTYPNAAGLAAAGGPLGVSMAVWAAAGQAAALLRTANIPATGPILAVAPDRLGVFGPLFGLQNPQNAFGGGMSAAEVQLQGPRGQIQNLTVVMALGLSAGKTLFFYRSAVRCFEDRYGAMQVEEPSVAGVQVGYAGDFETVILNNGGVINITQAA